MDWGLEAGGVAEIAHDDFAKPGEIARGQGRGVAMLDQPELALLWGGIGAEDFGGDCPGETSSTTKTRAETASMVRSMATRRLPRNSNTQALSGGRHS